MRLHLVALPHTEVSPAFCGCAYTAKILKFCKMMGGRHEIFVYAPEGPKIEGAKMHCQVLATYERLKIFGIDDPKRLPAWPTDAQTTLFNVNTIMMMRELIEPHDLILLSAGLTHKSIAEAFPNHRIIEPGVGYEGIFTNFCAFESYAWMHTCYKKNGIEDGRWFDAVIPNYFDEDDFPILNDGQGEYLLFLGRLISRKGPHIAAEIARACKLPLYVAGAGMKGYEDGQKIICEDGTELTGDVHYMGPVGAIQRAKLLAGAKALLVPTTYIEPFGGVAVEAMMAGTPVIAPDWGAFVETVQPGASGFRFRTLAEATRAVRKVDLIAPTQIREWARQRFSLQSVGLKFEHWFEQLDTLWEKGWYQPA